MRYLAFSITIEDTHSRAVARARRAHKTLPESKYSAIQIFGENPGRRVIYGRHFTFFFFHPQHWSNEDAYERDFMSSPFSIAASFLQPLDEYAKNNHQFVHTVNEFRYLTPELHSEMWAQT